MVCSVMSLRDFIKATARDVQAAIQAKLVQGITVEPAWATSSRATIDGGKARVEEEGEPLVKKKSKRSSREGREEEGSQKRRRRERARKVIYEEEGQEETTDVVELLPRQVKGGRPEEETELPTTPSTRTIGVTTVPLVDIEDVEKMPSRAGPSSIQSMYQPAWENISEDTLLNSPLL